MKRLLIATLLATLMAGMAWAADADQRVKAQLDELEFKYEVDGDGDFKMIFETEGERTQIVFVNSATNEVAELEIREVWAPALQSNGPFSAEVANRLLEDSQGRTLGGWQVMRNGDRYLAVYAVKLRADAPSAELRTAILATSVIADQLEKELTGKDDL